MPSFREEMHQDGCLGRDFNLYDVKMSPEVFESPWLRWICERK